MEEDDLYSSTEAFPNVSENLTPPQPNVTLFSQYPEHLLNAGAACCILFTILGVSGNLITILALARCPRLRNATTAFVINLCCADLLFCSFSLPLSAVTFLERKWNYSDTLCKLFALFRYSNGAVSIFSVIAITINRYIRIVHPQQYSSIYRPCSLGVMIAILWMSAFVLLSFPLFEVWGKLGYDSKVGTCSILRLNGKSPKMFIYVAAFGIPSLVFIVCYSRIYWVVRRASRNLRVKEACLSQATQQGKKKKKKTTRFRFRKCTWVVTEAPRIKRDRKELKILKVMLVVFVTYMLCYFPVSFVKIFRKEDDLHVLNILGYLLVYFSCCINPVIYVAMSDEYRQAYLQFFTCRSAGTKK